jgi:hypothetical protein
LEEGMGIWTEKNINICGRLSRICRMKLPFTLWRYEVVEPKLPIDLFQT